MNLFNTNKSRRDKGPFYKKVLFILIAVYISFWAYSYFTKEDGNKLATKMYKGQSLNDYTFYLVEKKYNPDTKELIAKIYFKNNKSDENYIPIAKENFQTEANYQDDITTKLKTEFHLPTKNYLVVSVKDVERNHLVRTVLKMKEDVITQDKENKASELSLYIDTPKKIFDDKLKLKSESFYVKEGLNEHLSFNKNEQKSVEKKIDIQQKEIKLTEKQINAIQKELNILDENEKINAEAKISELQNSIHEKEKEISNYNEELLKLRNKMLKIEDDISKISS